MMVKLIAPIDQTRIRVKATNGVSVLSLYTKQKRKAFPMSRAEILKRDGRNSVQRNLLLSGTFIFLATTFLLLDSKDGLLVFLIVLEG